MTINIDYEKEINKLKDEIKELKSSYEEKIKKLKNKGEDLIESNFSAERIEEKAREAGKTVSEFLKSQQDNLNKAKKACINHIEEHPVKSALYAFIGGAILTVIINKITNNK